MAIYMWREVPLITTAWIYYSPDLWLISLSSDWTNWITIADKNLWATTVYNYGDALSSANAGWLYQWGNTYSFPFSWVWWWNNQQVDATNYWPWNYYYNNYFRTTAPRDNSWNGNLRWWVTNTNEARKATCDNGFHIPSATELTSLFNICKAMLWNDGTSFYTYLKCPSPWVMIYNSGGISSGFASWWSSDRTGNNAYRILIYANSISDNTDTINWGCSVRPFANTTVQPDETRTVLYTTS